MAHLPFIKMVVESTIELLTKENEQFKPKEHMELTLYGLTMMVEEWLRDPDSVIDTLIALLADRDRRVVLLATIYLGLSKEILEPKGVAMGGITRAIDPINVRAKLNKDKNLGLAFGTTNTILGDKSAAKWMSQQMKDTKVFSETDFIKGIRMYLIKEVVEGWK